MEAAFFVIVLCSITYAIGLYHGRKDTLEQEQVRRRWEAIRDDAKANCLIRNEGRPA